MVERYYESAEFKGLNTRTQHVRRLILGHVCAADGSKPYKLLEARHIRRARDLKANVPESANGMVKAIRAVFTWAVQPGVELADKNPPKDVPYLEAKGDGHHSWTDAEVEQFERRHPIGSHARLALALLLYTSQRRGDVVLLGPSHLRDGWLHLTQEKNRDRKPIMLEIPIRPELQKIMDASPLGQTTFWSASGERHSSRRPASATGSASGATKPASSTAPLTDCAKHRRDASRSRAPRRMRSWLSPATRL